MKNKIFISHAKPEDDNKARWLGLQLIALGYEVWCDVFNLKGGEDFWSEIEGEIRNNTVKFLYILTSNSNQRDGCLKELSVAESVNKQIDDNRFIVALIFDAELGYDDININLKRKIHLDYKLDWQLGLKDLLRILEADPKTPKKENPDFEFIKNYWSTIYLNDRKPIEREETYSSNWFLFTELPQYLCFHNFHEMIPKKIDWGKTKYPTSYYKKHTATFGLCHDFIEILPDTQNYNFNNTKVYDVNEVLNDNYEDAFIKNRTLKNIINNLISTAFMKTMLNKGLLKYEMSDKAAFCFKDGIDNPKKYSFGQLTGKLKERRWHFAISGFPDLLNKVFVLRSHILFSEDGENIIQSKRTQQLGRRRQGKNWWNKHWHDKLMSMVEILKNDDDKISLNVGNDIFIKISSIPLSFRSTTSYIDPDESKEALDEYPDEEENIEELPVL